MKRILIVEDDSVLRENIVDMLSKQYSVTEASDGKKAIEVLSKDHEFDLVLSDIMMPIVDGYELYDFTRSSDLLSKIPFVFLTARADQLSVRKAMNLGADDYLTKPFTYSDLLTTIKTRITKKEIEIERFESLKNNISMYVPHELRTPLVSIIGNCDLISTYFDDFSKAEILEMNDSIKRSGERLHRSIEKFLNYTELTIQETNGFESQENKWSFNPYQHDLEYSISNCYDCYTRVKDVSFELENSNIEIPKNDFETILLEAITNSCKFSDLQTPITISGIIIDDKYIVEITDEGRGISEENIKRIDSFQQFDRNKFQQDGNGIGLAIVKLLCKKYNLRFSIKSEVDKYTSVTIMFPILKNN